jgi:hypothetical protein
VAFDSTGRLRVRAGGEGLRIEIAPPVSDPALRRRTLLFGSALAVGGFLALLRLSTEWQLLARGARGAFPPGLLLVATLAVLFGPLAVLGLLTLLFAEETIEVRPDRIVQEIAVFGKIRTTPVLDRSRARVVWTRWPIAPWWTWTFHRLAIQSGKARLGVGATLGTAEKGRLAEILRGAIE